MTPTVDSGAAVHVCPSWEGFSPLRSSAKQVSLRSVGRDVLHHFGSKTESYAYQSFNSQVKYENAPVVSPILSADMLISK